MIKNIIAVLGFAVILAGCTALDMSQLKTWYEPKVDHAAN